MKYWHLAESLCKTTRALIETLLRLLLYFLSVFKMSQEMCVSYAFESLSHASKIQAYLHDNTVDHTVSNKFRSRKSRLLSNSRQEPLTLL